MRIRMKETRRGSEDGFTVKEYQAGQEYELASTPRGEDLGQVFIRERWATEVKQGSAPPAVEEPEKRGDPRPAGGGGAAGTRKA